MPAGNIWLAASLHRVGLAVKSKYICSAARPEVPLDSTACGKPRPLVAIGPNIKQFENHLKTYLTYSPIALGVVWLYLLYRLFKGRREFQRTTGIDPFGINIFGFGSNPFNTEVERAAYSKLKRWSLQSFIIWIVSILIYIAVTLMVGAVLADRT